MDRVNQGPERLTREPVHDGTLVGLCLRRQIDRKLHLALQLGAAQRKYKLSYHIYTHSHMRKSLPALRPKQ